MFLSFFSELTLFNNNLCDCTIGQVAEAFRPNGFLCSYTVSVGAFLLGERFKGSPKMVAPYVCSVSVFSLYIHDEWTCFFTTSELPSFFC